MARHNTVSAAQSRLARIQILREEKRTVESNISQTQEEAIDMLDGLGQTSLTFTDEDGDGFKGSVVAGTTLDINPLKLKKRLGAKRYKNLTTAVLDMHKLEAAVASGDVNPKDVAACSTEKPKKPYIRITKSKS